MQAETTHNGLLVRCVVSGKFGHCLNAKTQISTTFTNGTMRSKAHQPEHPAFLAMRA